MLFPLTQILQIETLFLMVGQKFYYCQNCYHICHYAIILILLSKIYIINFIHCPSSIILMNSLYFAVNKNGYQLKPVPEKLNVDPHKQIPVYRVVSEFMNPKPKQQQVEPITQVEEEMDIKQNQFSSRSLDVGKHKKIKYVLMDTGKMMEKQEVSSVDLDSSAHEKTKQKETSVRDTTASWVRTVVKGNHMKITGDNLRNDKTNNKNDLSDKELLYLELQKQQTLRRNLENSYKNLLEKLKNEGLYSLPSEKRYQIGTAKNKLLSPTKKMREALGRTEQNAKNDQYSFMNKAKLRRSCCQLSSDQGEISLKCQQERIQNDYLQHLQNEKEFQTKLCEQIELCQERIEEIENNILKRQKWAQKEAKIMLNLQKENELLKLKEQNLQLKQKSSNLSSESQKSGLSIREHIHYMFTILIMFLVIAMMAKRHN